MAIVGGSWTYSGTPGASSKDAVRFFMGDTDSGDQLVSDEEIDWLISEYGSHRLAAAAGLTLAVQGHRFTDKKVGDLQIKGTDRAARAMDWVRLLRDRETQIRGGAYGGGISRADKATRAADTDRAPAGFYRGMDRMPGLNSTDMPEWVQETP